MKIGREVLDIASAAIRPGVTTDEIDKIVFNACVEREAYPSPLNYYHFPKSVCTYVVGSTLFINMRQQHRTGLPTDQSFLSDL